MLNNHLFTRACLFALIPALMIAASPVYVVLFTHIEDNSPAGTIGTDECRQSYLNIRSKMILMAVTAKNRSVQWVFQPDWKILEAALVYENAEMMANTGGMNFLRYMRDSLEVVIDPHSHENGGYNYTDVAYLLDSLGVGGSTVIGGHIWDPSLPQFAEWDRFREPVNGLKYPNAIWQGDILIGSGTPNHVNDPVVSGVWRPKDRDHYWDDDPNGNIVCVGAYHNEVAGVKELVSLCEDGTLSESFMPTASWNVRPGDITAPGGIEAIDDTVLAPLDSMRDAGKIVLTDFTSLANTWRTGYGAAACMYDGESGEVENAFSPAPFYGKALNGIKSTRFIAGFTSASYPAKNVFDMKGRCLHGEMITQHRGIMISTR